MTAYKVEPMSNHSAWRLYEDLLGDRRVAFEPEPEGLEGIWRVYSDVSTASTNLWMDAYLAAFARSTGHRFVTFDQAFLQFHGLDVELLRA